MIDQRFWHYHLSLPLLCFVIVFTNIEVIQLDISVANYIYALEGGRWLLKEHWLFSSILHTGARNVMVSLSLLVLISSILSFFVERLYPFRRALAYLACSSVISALLVTAGKHLSHVDCPWDLQQFGGNLPYVPLFENRPEWMPNAQCFPAGHASAGYAWLGLYFLAHHYRPQFKLYILGATLSIGVIFGVVQQLRGAHFISHDLVTLSLCWQTSLLLYPLFFSGKVSNLMTAVFNRNMLHIQQK